MAMADGVVYVPANNLCARFINKKQSVVQMPLPNPTQGHRQFRGAQRRKPAR